MSVKTEPVVSRYVRPKHIAERLAIDIQTVYRAVYSGDLPAVRFSKRTILIRTEDANTWIEANISPMDQVQP